MARPIRLFSFVVLVSCLVSALAEQAQSQRPVRVPDDVVRIGDFGLEARIPSAIDLVGPDDSAAGQDRAALAHRLQCWIDGIESCSVADRNDPRVRAMRRFLGVGPSDRDGVVTVHFPDETHIEVQLARVADPDPNDWDSPIYQTVVLPGTAQAPGLPVVPSRWEELTGFTYEGAPAVEAALERLFQRIAATAQRSGIGGDLLQ